MNKELFVSSTPHETKVGLVEDDLLAEVYLERENEYTLAGSIYKGRVTRVLPGMQSAFVDIGLERDAFLYVSDFMELEEHDEDVTDVVPANRGVQDMRPQAAAENGSTNATAVDETETAEAGFDGSSSGDNDSASLHPPSVEGEEQGSPASETSAGRDSQDRDRGGWRGRRRRRGGRRDGRERSGESRTAAPAPEVTAAPPVPVRTPVPVRPPEPSRTQFGPPAGYQPIILPGESLSKYRGRVQPPAEAQHGLGREERHSAAAATTHGRHDAANVSAVEAFAPIAATFPEDEPAFASNLPVEQVSAEPQEDPFEVVQREVQPEDVQREKTPSAEALPMQAATTVDWNREFTRMDSASAVAAAPEAAQRIQEVIEEEVIEPEDESAPVAEHDHAVAEPRVAAFAAAGTIEEETIDEEEADTVHFEQASDEGYDEFEEETQAAGSGNAQQAFSDARQSVDEIHITSLEEAGGTPSEGGAAESEEDSEELELEEAQAEAEAMLDAEARGTGTVDARAEVRASTGTAGYTQRAPRPRPGYDRRGGGRR